MELKYMFTLVSKMLKSMYIVFKSSHCHGFVLSLFMHGFQISLQQNKSITFEMPQQINEKFLISFF